MNAGPQLQKTLARPTSLAGVGVHTGLPSRLTFLPAPPNAGYSIVRMDLPQHPTIVPRAACVSQTLRGTVLKSQDSEVHTVEHVLSALAGLGIDNCRVELSAPEPPIMDGSALDFVKAICEAGLVEQPGYEKKKFRLRRNLTLADRQGNKSLVAWPYPGLKITYLLEYQHAWLKPQRVEVEVNPELYRERIAPSRTYCFEEEIQWLRAQGLARGGSLDNALVIQKDGIQNSPLRSEFELAYHKILDLIGDLALLGCPVEGHFVARRTGHAMNIDLVKLLEAEQRWEQMYGKGNTDVIIEAKEIEQILPHRYPMLLIDRILDLEIGKRIVGLKNVTMNEPFFQGHFPGHPIMPGVLIVEAMAQCGGVLLLKSLPDPAGKMVYFSGIDNVKFRRPVLPGDQLRFDMVVEKIRSVFAKMHGQAFVGEELACEADLMSALVDR